ncbi:MAG TPA: GNAT family N-acetyltransferase [Bryobacteraceae bacterium]|nr:GNAT family N-acetyltransferase [Bryobacteraceae bacterium]
MKERLKRLAFSLLGKNPEAVVVSFLTGAPELAGAMLDEIQRLEPGRRHFAVGLEEADARGAEFVKLAPAPARELYRQLRRRFGRLRVGLAPVLLTGDPQYRALRRAAFLLAPGKTLVYNARLERHHPRLRTALASLLFVRGVPLDRIFLRPRWLTPWRRLQTPPASEWELLAGRPFLPGRRRVAVLAPYFPYPLAHGGAVRMFHLLREMAREFDVVLFSFTESTGEVREPLLEFCSRLIVVPRPQYREPRWSSLEPPEAAECRSATMQTLWDGYTREFNVAVRQVEFTQMAGYGGDVLVAHDLNSDLRAQMLAREPGVAAWWNWWRWRRWERRAFARYVRVVVMSERDAALAARGNVRVVPNGVDTERFRPEPEPAGQHLLFIGSFRHFPNAVAWRFFAAEVWPLLAERFPEMKVTAVAGPNPLWFWRATTGTLAPPLDGRIALHGFVPDVRPFYAAANIAIVPTLASAGTNLKTLEAMAAGRAIVATPSGSKGLGLRHGVNAWIAKDARGFAEGVATLAGDPELRSRLAAEARRLAEREYDWKRIGAIQREVLHEVLDPPIMVRPAREGDVPDLDRIQLASPEAVLWEPHSYLSYECRVAEIAGRVAGFLVCRTLAADEAEVLSLVVDPALRRRGVAQRLMREALDGRPGTWYLEVRESNHAARKLYRKLGFEDISLRPHYYQDTGETAVVMRLKPC